jgi:hypothetical protein
MTSPDQVLHSLGRKIHGRALTTFNLPIVLVRPFNVLLYHFFQRRSTISERREFINRATFFYHHHISGAPDLVNAPMLA